MTILPPPTRRGKPPLDELREAQDLARDRIDRTLLGRLTGPTGRRGEAFLAVPCPHCQREHTHGWTLGENPLRTEHRAAHCKSGSPFLDGGYYVGLDPREKHAVPVPFGGATT